MTIEYHYNRDFYTATHFRNGKRMVSIGDTRLEAMMRLTKWLFELAPKTKKRK